VADDKYKEKKYRRPDGSTYMQALGPRSERDVEVKGAAAPKPEASPSPSPSPGPTARQTSKGPTTADVVGKSAREKADEATAQAKATEVLAPWKGKKIEQQQGGLGGRAAREAQKRSELPADKAGDAVAEDAEKKKKKKNNPNSNGGY
jgi:hypothetical protein